METWTEGLRMPYRMRDPKEVAAEFAASDQPYGVFIDNNLGSRKEYLRALCYALRPAAARNVAMIRGNRYL